MIAPVMVRYVTRLIWVAVCRETIYYTDMSSFLRLSRLFVSTGVIAMIAAVIAVPVWAASATVSITDTAFVPATLKVNVGDTINFKNATTSTQSAKSSSTLGFDTGNIGANQTKSVVVNTAGTYTYSSAFNPALSGTVEVSAASASATSTPMATTSGVTAQPVQTQAQPVSGVMDALLGVVALGLGSMLFGFGWQRRLGGESEVVPVQPVSLHEFTDSESNE